MTPNPEQLDYRALLKNAYLEIQAMRARLKAIEEAPPEPLAVIGMGCRFPGGADTPADFWRLLYQGVDAVTDIPAERWDGGAFYDPDPAAPGKTSTRWGGFLRQVDQFDPYFFGISPREAACMDPQQRLLLEVAWEALDDAGLPADRLAGSQTGVFVGIYNSDYSWLQLADPAQIDVYSAAGSGHSIAANRLSYLLDLHGPSIAVDTACSSSLVAVHLACQSLRQRECRLALAAGVNLILSPLSMLTTSKVLAMAGDGRCKTFDARADGIVRGEGCGVVVLKRLTDALADGDRVLALIRGSAINQDGRTAGLTAPNLLAQQAVLRQALASARVPATQIGYIEAHGTGTTLGDPIEIEALKEVLGQPRPDGRPCAIGSVKTNLGHLEAAAGIAGLIKAVLALRHQAIPPHLHFRRLNPNIALDKTPFVIPTAPLPWPAGATPRYAGVSSFGAGGTNAHVILEEAPADHGTPMCTDEHRSEEVKDLAALSSEHEQRAYLLPLSAQSREALRALAASYRALLAPGGAGAGLPLADIAYTASVRRSHYRQRLALAGHSHAELLAGLDAFLDGQPWPGMDERPVLGRRQGLAFVFSGQGPQWPGMGLQLLETEPVFRATVEHCAELMRSHVSWSLLDELRAAVGQSRLDETEIAQPALFALQVGLAALWRAWGIVPDAVVGHSVGEIAAAYVAGVLSLDDAVRVVCLRGQVMQRATGLGRMATVELPADAARQAIAAYADRLAVAAVNSPATTVLAGDAAALDAVIETLKEREVFCRLLRVNYAFHSPQMESFQGQLARLLGALPIQRPAIPIVSTVSGRAASERDFDAAYWGRQLRAPVLFAPAVEQLLAEGCELFVEIGPHPVLAGPITQCLGTRAAEAAVLPSLRRQEAERATLLGSLGALYTRGYPLDWSRLYPAGGRCVTLPPYPWQRERYWTAAEATGGGIWSAHWQPYAGAPTQGNGHHNSNGNAKHEEAGLTRAALLALAPAERRPALETYLASQVSRVMRIPAARLDVNQALTDLGIDSLTAVQLKNLIETTFGVAVPLVSFLQGPTIARLAALLLAQIGEPGDTAPAASLVPNGASPAQAEGPLGQMLPSLDSLSDEEVDRLLGQLLAESEVAL